MQLERRNRFGHGHANEGNHPFVHFQILPTTNSDPKQAASVLLGDFDETTVLEELEGGLCAVNGKVS